MAITANKTVRGFAIGTFNDFYGNKCNIQKSSLATDDCIWLGIADPDPQIMVLDAKELGIPTNGVDTGFVNYPIPDQVIVSHRMHLSRDNVKELIPILQNFVDTGKLII